MDVDRHVLIAPASAARTIARMKHYDVLVVGLGAVGSAAVHHLTAMGTSVLGIDRYAPPHPYGSTHGDTRITREAVGEGEVYVPFVRRSHELWHELEHETSTAVLHRTGGLLVRPASVTASMHGADDFLRSTIDVAVAHGIDHRLLDADELRREFPQFRVGVDDVGFFEPGAGYVLADDAVRAQLELAERRGATLRRDERVLSVVDTPAGAEIRTDRERYGADVVILAPGAWLPELIEPELARLFTVYRQVQSWFEPQRPGTGFEPDRCPIFIRQTGPGVDDVFYGFPAIHGPAGGVKIGTERYDTPTAPGSVRRTVDPAEHAAAYERFVRGRVLGVTDTVLRGITCLYTVTPDFGFVVDRHPGREHVVVAAACSGHGFKHSAAVGEATAALATGGVPRLDLSAFSFARFTG